MDEVHYLHDDIAVAGWSCRLPGAGSIAELWSLLLEGRCAISRVPPDRYSLERYGHPRRQERGKAYTWAAGVLDDIWGFDPAVFGISPREAEQMDPQQRIVLRLTWEALEDAGIRPSSIAGTDVGVYVGASMTEYAHSLYGDLAAADSHFATGTSLAVIANRVSYALDLHGPSFTIDTACSSSLVALNQAVEALRSGRIDTAIVAGVNVLSSPAPFVLFSQAMMLSPTGLCRAFSADADGFVRAEGGVVLILRKAAVAALHGNPIHGIVLASDVNSDGHTHGISLPSEAAQEQLITRVYSRAGIDPNRLAFVEAHGTGTQAGDPIEARAIGRSFAHQRSQVLPIGSIKTNIGHLEPASGLAGVVKALLALNHGILPASLHFSDINPNIPLDELKLTICNQPLLLSHEEQRCAGVNSFGFGGTNAHVVVAAGRQNSPRRLSHSRGNASCFTISAETKAALTALAQRYEAHLADLPDDEAAVIASAATHRRDPLSKRLAIASSRKADIVAALGAYAEGVDHPLLTTGEGIGTALPVAFVYSGNGSQWAGMGIVAFRHNVDFRKRFTEIDKHFIALSGWSLVEALLSESLGDRLPQTSVAQPLIFAIQSAATAALRKRGLHPTAVLGHSVGEIAAAEAAGILDLRTAVKIIYFRSLHQERVSGHGRMAAVLTTSETIAPLLAEIGDVSIAAINSPRALTVSGTTEAVAALAKAATARGIAVLDLGLDYPFHSALMAPIEHALTTSLRDVAPRAGDIPFISTVTGSVLPGTRIGANYWWRNIREPVRFHAAAREAASLGIRYFVEIGPRAVLLKHITDSVEGGANGFATLPVLATNDQERDPFPLAIAKAVVAGAQIETETVFGDDPGGGVSLPSYPWQQQYFHYAPTVEAIDTLAEAYHPLAGTRHTPEATEWRSHVDTALLPALADHKLGDQVVLPGTGLLEIAIFVARQWLKTENVILGDVEILKTLDLSKGQASELMTRLSPGSNTVEIFSRPRLSSAAWLLHCRCKIMQGSAREAIAVPQRGRICKVHDRAFIYDIAMRSGLPYGPAFRLAQRIDVDDNGLIGVTLDSTQGAGRYVVDPVRLDCVTHGIFLVFPALEAEKRGVTYIPVRVDEMAVFGSGIPQEAVIELVSNNERAIVANYYIKDAKGDVLAVLRGVRCQALPVRRPVILETAGLIELPRLLDGAFTRQTGIVPRAADIVRHLERNPDQGRFGEADRLLEGWAVAAAYEIAAALADHGVIALDILTEGGRLAAARRPWFVNLLTHLEAAGLAERHDGDWSLKNETLPDSASLVSMLARELPARAGELLVAGAVSGWIAQIIETGCILPPSDAVLSGAVLDFCDTTSASAAAADGTLSQLLDGIGGLWPKDRKLRVLQIGATPLTALLDALVHDRAIELTVFEFDNRRLENMRSALGRAGAVTLLNDLASLSPQSSDLIVSAGGLSRLPSHMGLAVLRKALAPQGLLIAVEPPPTLFAELTFGTQPDWFEPGLGDYPISQLRSATAWRTELATEGFGAVETATETCLTGNMSLIVVEAERSIAAVEPSPRRQRSVMIVDRTDVRELELSAALIRLLRAGGDVADLVTSEAGAKPEIVIHFPNTLDAPSGPAESLSARCFDMKACADRTAAKGTTLWYVFFGALNHVTSKVRPGEAGAWAFARTIANEFPQIDIRRIDVLPHVSPERAAELIRAVVLSDTDETELQIDTAAVRAVRVDAVRGALDKHIGTSVAAARLQLQPGSSRRLQWHAVDRIAPAADQIEVEVEATGLNFRDLMWMLALLPDDILEHGMSGPTLGLECAGRVVRVGPGTQKLAVGDRVAALTSSGFASHVTLPAIHAVKLPDTIPSEAGATIPVAFFTAYYALAWLAQLKRDEWVLIHGGAGAVGLAAIQIAHAIGARVIATAGSRAKRDLLKALGVAHVLDSRSTAFADRVGEITGTGVDVVLNSLAGEAMERSLGCLRPFGRFIELGKRDYVSNTHLGLRPFRRNLSYFGVDMDQLMAGRPELCEKLYAEVMAQFAAGSLSPLPYSVLSADNVAEAFHLMQQSSHIGKIVVRPPRLDTIRQPSTAFAPRAEGTHLITGAFGGFGLEIAKWLADHGAHHLVMIGRRGPTDPNAMAAVKELTARGVTVLTDACDVSDRHALERLFARIKATMPPLAGVIHAAMVLEDSTLANLDVARMERVLAPKVKGADNLDALTHGMTLDYFVLFSTLVTLIGNAGQGNYVAANAFMEGLARRRRQEGLPALAVGWGPIADVGVLVRNNLLESSMEKLSGVRSLTAREGLELMAQALAQPADDIDLAVITIAPSEGGFGGSQLAVLRSPTYAAMSHGLDGTQVEGESRIDVRALLDIHGMDGARRGIADAIAAQLARVLHARAEDVSRVRPLGEIGLDSLMALELTVSLETTFGAHVSLVGTGGHATVLELADEVIAQINRTPASSSAHATALAERHVNHVDAAVVEAVKEAIATDALQQKTSALGTKRTTSG